MIPNKLVTYKRVAPPLSIQSAFDVWNGEFLEKNGITSLESWKNNPAVQETGIRESFFTNYGYVNAVLSESDIPSLDMTFLANNENTKTVKFYS